MIALGEFSILLFPGSVIFVGSFPGLFNVFGNSLFFGGFDILPGEYMLNVKNKRMNSLKEEIECSKGHLLYLIDVHIFSKVPVNCVAKHLLENMVMLLLTPFKRRTST